MTEPIIFDYTVNDKASGSIDRINSKLQSLKSNYAEVKRNAGKIKEGVNFASALGIGAAASLSSGIFGDTSSPNNSIKKNILNNVSSFGEIANIAGKSASFLGGGILAENIMNKFSGSLGGIASNIGSSLGENFLSSSRLLGTLGRGALTGGLAIAAELGYEYAVKPSIDQLFNVKSYNPDYLQNLSADYINKSDKSINTDIWKEVNNSGDVGSTMWLLRELIGKNKESTTNLQLGLGKELASRNNDIAKSIWLQNRD